MEHGSGTLGVGLIWRLFREHWLLGAFGWNGNVVQSAVLRAGPAYGTKFWNVGDGFELEVVSRSLVVGSFGRERECCNRNVVLRAGPA